jgi:ATP-dependent Clp protease ATP-binding subunit ClpA
VIVPGGEPMPWPPDEPRFTESAKRALGFAHEEAARLNHNHLGAAHIFVGVVREPEGVAATALSRLRVTLDRARSALEAIGGRGEPIAATDITLNPRGQRVMEFAMHESRRLHHDHAGTEHLLLAAAHEHDGFVSRMLERLGLDEDGLTAQLLAELDVPFAYRIAENASPTEGPYEDFDDASKRALLFAQEEAARQGYGWVSAQDLLLGLARVAEADVSDVMRRTFADLELSVEKLRNAFPEPPRPQEPILGTTEMRFPASVKLIIEHAIHEAGKGEAVRPEHILLAVGTSQDAMANYSLRQLGATPERIREVVERPRR